MTPIAAPKISPRMANSNGITINQVLLAFLGSFGNGFVYSTGVATTGVTTGWSDIFNPGNWFYELRYTT